MSINIIFILINARLVSLHNCNVLSRGFFILFIICLFVTQQYLTVAGKLRTSFTKSFLAVLDCLESIGIVPVRRLFL